MSAVRGSLVVLAALLGSGNRLAAQACHQEYAGVTVTLVEDAHDGRHVMCTERLVPVDANSDLLIEFSTPPGPDSVALSPEWKQLSGFLGRMRDLEQEVARLNAAPTPENPAAQDQLRQEATTATGKVVTLMNSLDSLPLGTLTQTEILAGRFPGGTGDPRRPYANLNIWLDGALGRLTAQAEAFAAGKQRIEVLVAAFRDPRGGKRSALHVEHYDDLPIGELQPIDHFGLQLTPAERTAWEASVAFNQNIANALRNIQANRQTIEAQVRAKLDEVGQRLQDLAASLAAGPDAWATALPGRLQQLDTQAAAPTISPASKTALETLTGELRGLGKDYADIKKGLTAVDGIAATVRAAKSGDLRTLLFQPGGVVAQLIELDGSLKTSIATVATWPARLSTINAQLQALAQVLPGELASQLLPAEVASFFSGLPSKLSGSAAAVTVATDVLPASKNPIDAQGTLTTSSGQPLPHALDDLETGRVELARAGWVPGDRVLVSVTFREKQEEGSPRAGKASKEFSYRGEATLTGLHRVLSSALIFARPLHGADQIWKPNVAAMVSWHYFKRSPTSFGGKAWNWLDPGLGIHLASLDQGEDNFEFGVGGNLTIWGGLLSAGFGWNLSRSNGEYVLLAIDLFETLNRIRQ